MSFCNVYFLYYQPISRPELYPFIHQLLTIAYVR